MSVAKVFIDENTKLDDKQKELLNNSFDSYILVSLSVLTPLDELNMICSEIENGDHDIVFACYNPFALNKLAKESGRQWNAAKVNGFKPGTKRPLEVYTLFFDPGSNQWKLVR